MIRRDPSKLPSPIRSSPPKGGNAERGRHQPTHKFTANTCRKCGAITIAGLTYGLRIDLEPQVLDDHTEYAALLDGVPTYDLWPDLIARRRHLENIRQPDKAHRHARHTCDRTYGTRARPAPAVSHRPPAEGPPPF
jgi:hypothetical protein